MVWECDRTAILKGFEKGVLRLSLLSQVGKSSMWRGAFAFLSLKGPEKGLAQLVQRIENGKEFGSCDVKKWDGMVRPAIHASADNDNGDLPV